MTVSGHYTSPLGEILLAADERGLTGLWLEGQKSDPAGLPAAHGERRTPILAEAARWLDVYFSGQEPDFLPPLYPLGSEFQLAVWELSAQAVGGAVGHNRISVMIPCHRVVGTNGSLTGYAGGLDKKIRLLELEHADMTGLFIPKRGTAL